MPSSSTEPSSLALAAGLIPHNHSLNFRHLPCVVLASGAITTRCLSAGCSTPIEWAFLHAYGNHLRTLFVGQRQVEFQRVFKGGLAANKSCLWSPFSLNSRTTILLRMNASPTEISMTSTQLAPTRGFPASFQH